MTSVIETVETLSDMLVPLAARISETIERQEALLRHLRDARDGLRDLDSDSVAASVRACFEEVGAEDEADLHDIDASLEKLRAARADLQAQVEETTEDVRQEAEHASEELERLTEALKQEAESTRETGESLGRELASIERMLVEARPALSTDELEREVQALGGGMADARETIDEAAGQLASRVHAMGESLRASAAGSLRAMREMAQGAWIERVAEAAGAAREQAASMIETAARSTREAEDRLEAGVAGADVAFESVGRALDAAAEAQAAGHEGIGSLSDHLGGLAEPVDLAIDAVRTAARMLGVPF
jgi:chromosome segregation ATPase